jgi:hypothetical protein
MKKTGLILGLLLICFGCETEPKSFAESIEAAHEKENFTKNEAVQFDLHLSFNEKLRLEATFTLLTNSTKGKIEETNGQTIYYDSEHVYVSANSELTQEKARFRAYTWSYFFLLPNKMTDEGTKWNDYPKKGILDESYNAEKLTFDSGTGDAPDDWYLLFQDQKTELVKYAAYIVTANKSVAEAEEDPHAIEYLNYEEIDGVPIATEWKFHGWDLAKNRPTSLLGTAYISNVLFLEAAEDFFNAPADFTQF